MLKSSLLSLSLLCTTAAYAATDCAVPPLNQAEKSAPLADAAKQLRATNPCKLVPGLSAKSLASVWSGLLSNRKTGGRRLEPAVPDGMPSGSVLGVAGAVQFDLRAVAAEGIRSFQLTRGQQTVLSQTTPKLEFAVPASGNEAYQWTLLTRVASYHGEYTLLEESERSAVQEQLVQLEKVGLDAVSRLLYQAAIYDDANLFSERDRVYAQLRTLLAL